MSVETHPRSAADGQAVRNPDVLGGVPVFAGTRVAISWRAAVSELA